MRSARLELISLLILAVPQRGRRTALVHREVRNVVDRLRVVVEHRRGFHWGTGVCPSTARCPLCIP